MYVPVQISFDTDRKTKRLRRAIRKDAADALVCLHEVAELYVVRMWLWAMFHARDGDLTKFELSELEDAVRWPLSGTFVRYLRTAGWIDVDDQTVRIHGWSEPGRGGHVFERYEKGNRNAAERQRRHRRKARRQASGVTPPVTPGVGNEKRDTKRPKSLSVKAPEPVTVRRVDKGSEIQAALISEDDPVVEGRRGIRKMLAMLHKTTSFGNRVGPGERKRRLREADAKGQS